ncbi:oxidative stress-induced growth inhibitor 2-like [Oratosquilla oratoria]|uniref:oxidative stress-induced growth inhibitor 2-like n=1 Tax=Oratosquilla oratoria TaxID=337810 RepID=UPI003F760186
MNTMVRAHIPRPHPHHREVIHKDVVIIGNGPSGITLSYLLSGHLPYYGRRAKHPVAFLHDRLYAAEETPLIDLNLRDLSEGLEGRSNNPVAVLFDALHHPEADVGLDNPSALEWRYEPERAVDHVVLGKNLPGGAWQSMEGDFLTLSLGAWMELPGLDFCKWLAAQGVEGKRATVHHVAQYYRHYVKAMDIEHNFSNFTNVTSVRRLSSFNDTESRDDGISSQEEASLRDDSSTCTSLQDEGCADCRELRESRAHSEGPSSGVRLVEDTNAELSSNTFCCGLPTCLSASATPKAEGTSLWEVRCARLEQDKEGSIRRVEELTYVTPKVVLATGTADLPNNLGTPGEHLPFVLHSLREVEESLRSGALGEGDRLLVVGAGLSAADAIIAARAAGVNVAHAFRRTATDKSLIFNKLPRSLYPEYHEVYSMMKGSEAKNYLALPRHNIQQILPSHVVRLEGENTCGAMAVNAVAILIGTRPDLSFIEAGTVLGEQNMDSSSNKVPPVQVDAFSHECPSHPGLYAMGPLVGDNFVRFLQGGALAIASSIMGQKRK